MSRLLRRSPARHAAFVFSIAVVGALTLVGLPVSGVGAAPSGSANSLGVYLGYQSPGGVSSFGHAIGRQPSFAMDFLNGDSWSALVKTAPSYMAAWKGSGLTMIWGIPILPYDSTGGDGLQQGAAGVYNSSFLKLAQDMVAGGEADSIIRLGWEFNGNWFPWAADGRASSFIAYWRQIVDTMRSVAGQEFTFEWNPDAGGTDDLADDYPGSSYVDYIGLDLYDQAWGNYGSPGCNGATCQQEEFNTFLTEQNGLNWLAGFAAAEGKPIVLPEWGLGTFNPTDLNGTYQDEEVGGGDDPTFINGVAQWIRQNNVDEATFWQFQQSRISPISNPLSDAAFITDFGLPLTSSGSATSSVTLSPGTGTGNTGNTGGSGNTGSGNGISTGSQASGEIESTVKIQRSPSPVVSSKKTQFAARIRTETSTGATPTGSVRWTVRSASGASVPCASAGQVSDQADAMTACTVPAGKLWAAAGPYTVSVDYAGGGNIAPAADSLVQHVVRANSLTNVRVGSTLLPGKRVQLVASIKARSATAGTPTGAVSFSVWDKTGRAIPCGAGDTDKLLSGKATCVFGNTSAHAPYFVRVAYKGDGNFTASGSKVRGITVRQRHVSFLP